MLRIGLMVFGFCALTRLGLGFSAGAGLGVRTLKEDISALMPKTIIKQQKKTKISIIGA